MSQPTVLINSFIEENENKLHLDPVSKYFIILEAVFGYNRTSLLNPNKRFSWLFIIYSFLIAVFFIYVTLLLGQTDYQFVLFSYLFQYLFCGFFCFVQCGVLKSFYNSLNTFDNAIGFRPAVDHCIITNILQIVCTCIIFVIVWVLPYLLEMSPTHSLRVLILRIIYAIEIGYYAHLLCLFVPRLKLINYYIESLMLNAKNETQKIPKTYISIRKSANDNSKKDMKQIMEVYRIIVEAYDHLLSAVKWPLVTIIVSSFISLLVVYIILLLNTAYGERFYTKLIVNMCKATANVLPLFGPCVFGDCVHGKVVKLRELLAAALYQNRLDKSGRAVARSLLEYTETRNLSFCLLRVLYVDISLPFKFVALLVTYIIIVLQFDKVIHPVKNI